QGGEFTLGDADIAALGEAWADLQRLYLQSDGSVAGGPETPSLNALRRLAATGSALKSLALTIDASKPTNVAFFEEAVPVGRLNELAVGPSSISSENKTAVLYFLSAAFPQLTRITTSWENRRCVRRRNMDAEMQSLMTRHFLWKEVERWLQRSTRC